MASSGDQIAVFSELLEEHRGRLFGYVYAMLHNLADAEDVYQQTTVLLWQKFDEFEPGTDFGSWALRVAYFSVKNFQRSSGRHRRFFSDAVMESVAESYTPRDKKAESHRIEALKHCVARLSPGSQRLVLRRYGENASVQQIAQEEGRSEAALAMALSRVRKALFRCIQSRLALG